MMNDLLARILRKINSTLYLEPRPRREAAGVVHHSRFGGFWIDRTDATALLERKLADGAIAPALASDLRSFIEHGFVILKSAVDPEHIDTYRDEFARACHQRGPLKASIPADGPQDQRIVPLHEADIGAPLTKVLDTYQHLRSAHELIFAERIKTFVRAVFEEDLVAFQGLHFERGSTQAMHQDTAYVVLSDPMKFCASWIALEDIAAGSGELVYYPGSHRFADWVYQDRFKHYNHRRDRHEDHLRHLASLHEKAASAGIAATSFRAEKGDALIWSADLAHGGGPILDARLTRRSLVTHYAPASTTPHYLRYKPMHRRRALPVGAGCATMSFYDHG